MFLLLLIRTTEESSPRVKPKFKTDTKFKDSERSSRLGEVTPDPKRKFSKPKAKFPKSTDKVNVWSKQEKAKAKERKRAPCWLVVFVFCCGVSKEHQWYSLLGKGDPNSAFTIEPPRPPSDHGAAVQSIKPLRLSVHVPILARNQRSPNTTFPLTGKERAVKKVASITMITSILSILCCGLQAYSLFGVHGAYTRTVTPKPWPWFAFETSFRLIELAMGFMLSYCVLHPYVGRRKRSFTKILCPKRKGKTATPRIVITPINGRRDGDFS